MSHNHLLIERIGVPTASPFVVGGNMLNAADFPTLHAAYAALPAEGGEIYLPALPDAAGNVRKYTLTDTLEITKPVRFVGDGRGATIIQPSALTFTMFDVRASFVHFEKLTIDGMATDTSNAVDGIIFNGLGPVGSQLCQGCTIREVEIIRAGRNALRLIDVIIFDASDSFFTFAQSDGLVIDITPAPPSQGTTTLRFFNCTFAQNVGRGASLPQSGVGITFLGCVFQGNDGGTGSADGCGLMANSISRVELISCYFEEPPPSATEQFVHFASCLSAVVENCVFFGAPPPAAKKPNRAVRFANCGWARFANNTASNIANEMVHFDSDCFGAVEFGNRDFDPPAGGTSRIKIDGRGVLSHSSGATNLGRFFNNNRPPVGTTPGSALPGSILWREDPDANSGESRIQISDGTAWRNMPVLQTTRRSLFLPAIALRPRNGTNTLTDQGTYPNRYTYAAWAGNSATQDGMGVEWSVPPDYATGSNITFKVIWSYDTIGVGKNWVCELNLLSRSANESMTAAGTSLSVTIDANRGAANDAFFDTIGSSNAGLAAGEVVRLNVNRNAPSASDNFTGQVRFMGLAIEYATGI